MKIKDKQQPLRITPVVTKSSLKALDQDQEDLAYWLSMPVPARAAALTYIIAQSLKPGQRMDKSFVQKGKRIKA